MTYLRKIVFTLAFFVGMGFAVLAQLNSHPESYQIDQKDINRARQIITTPLKRPVIMPKIRAEV